MKDWKEFIEWVESKNGMRHIEENRYVATKQRLIEEGFIEANPKKKRVKAKPLMMTTKQAESLELFDDIWSRYPKKVGKKEAIKSWLKLELTVGLYDKIWNHIDSAYVVTKTDKQFIPNLSTYLNQARWNDEIITYENNKANSAKNSVSDETRGWADLIRKGH